MKRTLLIASTFLSAMTFAQDCSELFISEYVEGSSNNKGLEIYNPTASTIDLSQYIVIRFSNGGSTALTNYTVQLTGNIAPYSTHVGILDKRVASAPCPGQECAIDAALEAKGDAFYSPVYNTNSTFYWNGNDAIALAKGSASNPAAAVLVDIFGKIGEDPGTAWTSDAPYTTAAGGAYLSKDHSLIRKPNILKGVTNPIITSFNALAEYDSIPEDSWSTLGWHPCDCAPASLNENTNANVSIYPNPSTGEFLIKGTTEFTSIVVVNSLGQVVESIKNNAKSVLKIDLSNRKGVYFVKLSDDSGVLTTKKVIIK